MPKVDTSLKIKRAAKDLASLTFSEIDQLVEEMNKLSPTLSMTFQSALYENLKARGDIKWSVQSAATK